MALLPLQSSFIITCNCKPNNSISHFYNYKSLSSLPTKPKLIITSQDSSSQSSKPSIEETPSNEKPISSAQGFGSGSGSGSGQIPKSKANPEGGKKKQKGRKERASIIRRSPVGLETPVFLDKKGEEEVKEQSQNESAFLLAWLGLGVIILLQGIALAASGFLPEELDNFFVKFLYPSFTPTVFLFVAGTVTYGVFKYLQNESLRNQK